MSSNTPTNLLYVPFVGTSFGAHSFSVAARIHSGTISLQLCKRAPALTPFTVTSRPTISSRPSAPLSAFTLALQIRLRLLTYLLQTADFAPVRNRRCVIPIIVVNQHLVEIDAVVQAVIMLSLLRNTLTIYNAPLSPLCENVDVSHKTGST